MAFKHDLPSPKITFFGVESIDNAEVNFLDLNMGVDDKHNFFKTYDLVHCAQVFEHIFDIKNALINLITLCKSNGLISISVPASCRAHGSPEYFSAGYEPAAIANLARIFGMSVELQVKFGSPRSYLYEHMIRRWPDKKEYENPILRMTAGRKGKTRSVLRWLKYLPGRFAAQMVSGVILDNSEFATQTLVILRKPGKFDVHLDVNNLNRKSSL